MGDNRNADSQDLRDVRSYIVLYPINHDYPENLRSIIRFSQIYHWRICTGLRFQPNPYSAAYAVAGGTRNAGKYRVLLAPAQKA